MSRNELLAQARREVLAEQSRTIKLPQSLEAATFSSQGLGGDAAGGGLAALLQSRIGDTALGADTPGALPMAVVGAAVAALVGRSAGSPARKAR